MKKILLILAGTVLAVSSQAQLLFYDGFEYTAGQFLAPRNDTIATPNPGLHNVVYNVDWRYAGAGGLTQNAPSSSLPNLTYTGLQPSAGGSALFDTTQLGSARVQVTSSAIGSGTVYWSALMRVDDIGTLTTGANGMLLGGFNNTAGPGGLPTVVGAVLRIRQDMSDPTAYHIGTGMNSGTGSGTGGANVQFANSISHTEGETVFIVGSYEFIAGANNDIARMWINPGAVNFGAGTPPIETLLSSPGSAIADTFSSLISFNLRNVNSVGAPTVYFDELRVGMTWADVTPVPEPNAVALLGLGLLAAGWVRSQRR